ncbi:MAG: LysR family transcriptional regulator [Anaerovorax sp.]|nr:LysR family transcriptional regulator [Anaerovorax sp.]
MFKKKELVCTVNNEKSFSKAAEKLIISQPSLSASIKKIEEEIGMPLFDRSTNPIQLTECGREYIKCAEQIYDMENSFLNYINDLTLLRTGTLTVGTNHLYSAYILPPIVSSFINMHPNIRLNLIEGSTYELERKLFNGDIDLVIDTKEFSSDLFDKYYFGVEHLVLAVPRKFECNHRITQYQLSTEDIIMNKHINSQALPVPFDIFKDEPFILMKNGSDTRERTDKIFKKHGIKPNIVLELEQLSTVFHIISIGTGVSLVSDTLIRHTHFDAKNLCFYKLSETDLQRNIFFQYKKNKYISFAMKEFIHLSAPINSNL